MYPEDRPPAQQLFEMKRRGNAKPFRFKLRREDGSGIWVDVQSTPLREAAGIFIGIIGIFTIGDESP